jgi:hypothetical protein
VTPDAASSLVHSLGLVEYLKSSAEYAARCPHATSGLTTSDHSGAPCSRDGAYVNHAPDPIRQRVCVSTSHNPARYAARYATTQHVHTHHPDLASPPSIAIT